MATDVPAYTPTTWNPDAAPGISAAELQRMDDQVDDLSTQFNIHNGGLAASDHAFGSWDDWTPTYTQMTVGNGTRVARFVKGASGLVTVYYRLEFGTTTAITAGNPTISLPVNADSVYGTAGSNTVGTGYMEPGGSQPVMGDIRIASATHFGFGFYHLHGSNIERDDIAPGAPFTWGTGDVLACTFSFEPA